MKKGLLVVSASLAMLLAACGGGKGGESSGGQPVGGDSTQETVNVTSVTITGATETTVFGGTKVTLKAVVEADGGAKKVTWSTSDDTVATVTNGVVNFKNVAADSTVTITATSKDDNTKSATVDFTVKYSPINLADSRGNGLDSSDMLGDGIHVDAGDTALIFNKAKGTKWYAQATITIDSFMEGDDYPKFGLMVSNQPDGYWNATTEAATYKNAFLFVDAMASQKSSGWQNIGFVGQNDEHTDWNWGGNKGFTLASADKVSFEEEFTLGILRDGVDYYAFAQKGNAVSCYRHYVYDDIAADEDAYIFVGGWATGAFVKDFVQLVGDEVEDMYATPTDIDLGEEEVIVYTGDEYKINVAADVINFDNNKLEFTSSDEEVLTVDADGVIHTLTEGEADVTVKFGEGLTKVIHVISTTDATYSVEFDGRQDDAVWNEAAKANTYRLQNNATNYIDFSAARNGRGVYIFADYYVSSVKNVGNGWWESDNFECYFAVDGERAHPEAQGNPEGQMWVSANGTTNMDKMACTALEYNEETGLYHMTFEVFMALKTLGATKDSKIQFGWGGFNPACGWKSMTWGDKAYITTSGLARFADEEYKLCSNGDHVYGDFAVTKEVSCAEDGERTRTCIYCLHNDVEIIEKGAHTFNPADADVITPSTCSTKGVGSVECTTCHNIVTVELPLDPTNHGDAFEGEYCTACHEHIHADREYSYVMNNRWNGWGDPSHQLEFVHERTDDFTAKVNFHLDGGLENGGDRWQTALLSLNGGLIRMDQIGYLGEEHGFTANYGEEGWDATDGTKVTDYTPILKNCDVELNATRTGTLLSIDYEITNLADGAVYHAVQSYVAAEENKAISLALGGERCIIAVSHADCDGVSVINGKMSYQAFNSNVWNASSAQFLRVATLSGDFEAKLSFNMQTNIDVNNGDFGGECWKGCLPLLVDPDNWANRAVCRWDWFGWCDGSFAGVAAVQRGGDTELGHPNCESWIEWGQAKMGQCMLNMNVDATITRVGNDVTFNYTIYSVNLQETFHWTQTVYGIPTDSITIAFSGESARMTITSVKY